MLVWEVHFGIIIAGDLRPKAWICASSTLPRRTTGTVRGCDGGLTGTGNTVTCTAVIRCGSAIAIDRTATMDNEAAVKWITWDSNQWVSYDDGETVQMKVKAANELCLGGIMIWSLDQDSSSNTSGNDFLGIGVTNGVAATDAEKIRTLQASAQAVANNRNSCYWSFCGQECTVGFIPETYAKGQVTGISLDTTCSGDDVQTLCCAPGTNTGTCDWYGWRGVGMPCVTGYCPEGSDLIAINSECIIRVTVG